MSVHKKLLFAGLVAFLFAGPALAQGGVGVGATIGLVNDVTDRFHVDEFKSKDANLWVDYEVQDRVLLRATLGTLRVKGSNAGEVVTPPGTNTPVVLPDLTSHMDYASIGVSYQFLEGGYTSGIFAGFGGYKVRPDSVAPEIANYRDQRETVFGWHGGVDGSFQIVSRLSFLVRLTYHGVRSEKSRSLLTANAGFVYRF